MRPIKKWFYIVICLVWLLLLYFLTPIILLFVDHNMKESSIAIDVTGDPVNYWIDSWVYYDNVVPTITVDGWAFVETEQDNINKTVKLIFVSDDVSYEVDTDLGVKQRLVQTLNDKKVPKERTAFSTTFSPLGMKNDVYTLYLYVSENDENYGILNTGREFRKGYRNFIELNGGEIVENKDFSKASVNNSINYRIDWCRIKDGKLDIYGWAFLENTESSENRIYLEIQKPDGTVSFYSTKRFFREGVGEYFKDDRYNHSGFQALIPLSAIGQGDNIITIIIGTDSRAVNGHTFFLDGKTED